MRRTLALAALCGLLSLPAMAQSGTVTLPGALNGYGTLSLTAASTNLSTLTVGPSSNAWTMPFNGTLTVYNSPSSAGLIYVCLFGGTCSSSVGIPVSAGGSLGLSNLGGRTTSPTVIAASTATVLAWW